MGDHGAGQLTELPSHLFSFNPETGQFDLHLTEDDRAFLRQLGPSVIELLEDPGDPVLYRLFPPAYSDPAHIEHQEEYRRLMQEDLVERHRQQLELLTTLSQAPSLTEEQLMGWVRAINSLRLVLGTSLDVGEDDEDHYPETPEEAVYMWLGFLVGEAVDALSGGY